MHCHRWCLSKLHYAGSEGNGEALRLQLSYNRNQQAKETEMCTIFSSPTAAVAGAARGGHAFTCVQPMGSRPLLPLTYASQPHPLLGEGCLHHVRGLKGKGWVDVRRGLLWLAGCASLILLDILHFLSLIPVDCHILFSFFVSPFLCAALLPFHELTQKKKRTTLWTSE